jgi:hypothetical protein
MLKHYPLQIRQPGDVLKPGVYRVEAAEVGSNAYPIGFERLGYPVDVAEDVFD